MTDCIFAQIHSIQTPTPELNERETRGNPYQLKTKKPRLAIRKNFFAVAAVANWNSLPETVVRCDNVNAFKKFRQTLGTQNVQHRVTCEKWTHMKQLIDRCCGLQIRKEPVTPVCACERAWPKGHTCWRPFQSFWKNPSRFWTAQTT